MLTGQALLNRRGIVRARTLAPVIAACAAALTGCVGGAGPQADPRPEWINSPQTARETSLYLVALGSGPTQEEAERNAAAALAQEIGEATGRRGRDAEEYRKNVAAIGLDPAVSAELLELDQLDLARDDIGFEIVERYSDPAGTWHYALAGADRTKLAATYEAQMRQNAELADRAWNDSAPGGDSWRELALLRAALVAVRAYNELAAARERLGGPLPQGEAAILPPRVSVEDIDRTIMALRSSVAVALEDAGDDVLPPILETEIRAALQDLRVPVVVPSEARGDAGAEPDASVARVAAGFAFEPVHEQMEGTKLGNWRMIVEVFPPGSGQAIDLLALDGKGGGRTLADAENEAVRQARQQLRERIGTFLGRALAAHP